MSILSDYEQLTEKPAVGSVVFAGVWLNDQEIPVSFKVAGNASGDLVEIVPVSGHEHPVAVPFSDLYVLPTKAPPCVFCKQKDAFTTYNGRPICGTCFVNGAGY